MVFFAQSTGTVISQQKEQQTSIIKKTAHTAILRKKTMAQTTTRPLTLWQRGFDKNSQQTNNMQTDHGKAVYSVATMSGKEVSIKIANKPIICKNTIARQLTLWQQCRAAAACLA